jgi:cardiolipin synthase
LSLAVIEWILCLIMVPIVANRHAPTSALAWLIFIFFKPWLGLICYLLVGDNLVMRRRLKSHCERLKEVKSLEYLDLQQPHLFRLPKDPSRLQLVELTERLVCMPTLRGNRVELLDDGCHVIERIIADIDAAKQHVHMLFYIFKDDSIGRRVADAMAGAASRGVHCRLVVDAFGSRSLRKSLEPRLISLGIEVHHLMHINPFRRHLTRLDLRNHRKLVVIDGILGYTGSQNIEEQDYDSGQAEAWQDLMVKVVGPAVLQLQMVFLEDWHYATGTILEGPDIFPIPESGGDIPIQVVPSGPVDSNTALRDVLVASINGARERITITSPYFIPDEPLLIALHLASLHGVRVDLIVPRHADHPIVGAVARAYFDNLIGSGVRVYFHKGLLHAKTMSVDDTVALIGSANFDRRSFFLHSELSLLLYGAQITGLLRSKQMEYIAQSDEIDPERWSKRSRGRQLRDTTVKLLSPLL